jgi:hypothetical protein
MSDKETEEGIITVVLQRMVHQRLPRALALKEHVDNGGLLSEQDILFLQQVFDDSQHINSHMDLKDHPELIEIVGKMATLYHDITSKALENERNA